jgi:DNA integrity scanning protein DisA with diadenylate cyclase activity
MPTRKLQHLVDEICCRDCTASPDVLEEVIVLAVEIAREGREGRKIGTLFVVGDAEAVLARSRPLILDPLAGHSDEARRIGDPNMRETIKELAQLDGGFVVTDDGVACSAARYFSATAEDIDLPLGLGSRHMAGASISKHTRAIAIVVSDSSVVRVFEGGELISKIIPELWMIRRHELYVGPEAERPEEAVALDD